MSKLIAILGDIHANIDALEVVLSDSRAQGATDYLCTGDIVGYGAAPRECLQIVRDDLGCPVVKGNHDHYVASDLDLSEFHPNAAAGVLWTRGQLAADEVAWLGELPFTVTKMGIALVHSTMDSPENFGYVFDHLQAEANFIRQKTPLCFHGHTHCPMIYEKQLAGVYRIDPVELPNGDGSFTLPVGRKYFINVGSVGQPRDGDPRAAYVLYDPVARKIWFRRLEYDVAAAQRRILAAGLPPRLAERLQYGQ